LINHPTAPSPIKRYFRTASLSSSLNVLRAAVQGEQKLQSMPNNTCIMISFAACFAVYLSTLGKSNLAPSIRVLIEESAGVLERIGTVTPHRNGTSYLYGRHLREIISNTLNTPMRPQTPTHNRQTDPPLYFQPSLTQPSASRIETGIAELMQFSAMSDRQIDEAILNVAGEEDFDFEGWSQGTGDPFGEVDFGMGRTRMEGSMGRGVGMGNVSEMAGMMGMGMQGLDWLNWFNIDVGDGAAGGEGL
jgi:hypothetical protein